MQINPNETPGTHTKYFFQQKNDELGPIRTSLKFRPHQGEVAVAKGLFSLNWANGQDVLLYSQILHDAEMLESTPTQLVWIMEFLANLSFSPVLTEPVSEVTGEPLSEEQYRDTQGSRRILELSSEFAYMKTMAFHYFGNRMVFNNPEKRINFGFYFPRRINTQK